jgi:hypothetical protein
MTGVTIAPVTYDAVLSIARNMRAGDAREIWATRWIESPEGLAADVMRAGEYGFVISLDEEPVAAIGAAPNWPNVWNVWMFSTDKWPKVALSVTKFVRRVMIPNLYKAGATRVHCMSIAGHSVAHRWLESLGAIKGNREPGWGKNGEDFFMFRWDRKTIEGLGYVL